MTGRILHTERTARRDYPCSWECGDPIKAGARYVRSALPPWTEPNESDHWWTARLHGHTYYDCPSRRRFAPAEPAAPTHETESDDDGGSEG